jgi:outer membrane protein
MKHQLFILLFCLSWVIPTKAQQKDTVATFTLNQAISYAQKHQSSILNAQIDEQIAKNTVKQTIGIGLPQLSGNASFQDFIKIPTSLLPGEVFGAPGTQIPVQFGVKYNSSFGLELNQLVFDGTYLVGLKATQTYKELSIKNTKRSRIETAVAVTKAYYSVLVSNEQLSLLDANLDRLKKSLKDTEQLFKNGFVEKIDVDRLTVLNNNLVTERENVIRLLALNKDLLKFQMGMTIGSELNLTDQISNVSVYDNAVLINDSTAYRKRVEFSLLETQKVLNDFDVKRYKSAFLPSLSAFGSTSNNFQSNSFGDLYDKRFPTTVVGLRLAVPIISGGQKKYQLANAKLAVLKTENDLYNLQNTINLDIKQAQTTYKNGQQSLENQRRNMDLAKEVLRVTKIKYEQGVGSSLEVTTAETSLKEAQNNYISALYDMLINKVNLDKALGNINY